MPSTVVVGAQWGDEGKGKIVDLLAQESDVVCRYQGGPNAGHTIIVDGETFKIRQVPSGVISGKTCVIAAGCVVDPQVFLEEIDDLEARSISTADVHLSGNAHLIMPWHVAIDQASERRLGKLQIGTTRRGIGPAYADKASRIGIRVQDLLDPKILRQKIETALAEKNVWLERVYEVERFELEEVATRYAGHAERLAPFVSDTSLLVDTALGEGRRVLFESAQGTLLDLDHGTYPFVTSSNPIAANAATGTGIGPNRLDEILGVAKAYVTRVGEGPLPSEIQGPDQDRMREARRRIRDGDRTGAPVRVARPRGAALRSAAERDHVAGADEAGRPLGVRGDPRLRALCVAGRVRDARLPGASVGLSPLPGDLRDAPGLGAAARRGNPAGGRPRLRRIRGAGDRRARDAGRHGRLARERPDARLAPSGAVEFPQ